MPLPADVLRARLSNELDMCQRELRHHISISDPSVSSFPLMLNVTLMRIPGPVWDNGRVVTRFVHRFSILVTEDYPSEKPLVKWMTPIFHPNIMDPSDGGYVCTKLLEKWDFSSTLVTFIKGIESLLANPNPRNPFGNDICTRAAAYFNRNRYQPPALEERACRPIRIVGSDDA
jgi:ubiquitin-protein ligase